MLDRLVALDEAVADGAVHELACAGQPRRVEIRTVDGEVVEDLVEDPVGPLGPDEFTRLPL